MKKKNYMSYRTLADMHYDGVYFNEQLLAIKKKKDLQLEKLKNKF
ncbi:hypothetical protein [Winogradskyella sp.]